jgi:hypothetical protein
MTISLPRSSLLFVLVITGCSVAREVLPTTAAPKPRPEPPPVVVGTYELLPVKGTKPVAGAIPDRVWEGLTPTEILSGRLDILDGGNFRQMLKLRVSRNGLEEVMWRELTGEWTMDGFQLLLVWDRYGRARWTQRGDTIGWDDPGNGLRFLRVR